MLLRKFSIQAKYLSSACNTVISHCVLTNAIVSSILLDNMKNSTELKHGGAHLSYSIWEAEAILLYRVGSRTAKAIQKNPILKNKGGTK